MPALGEEGAGLALGFMETESEEGQDGLPPTCSRSQQSLPGDGHVVWGHTAPGFEPQLLTAMAGY